MKILKSLCLKVLATTKQIVLSEDKPETGNAVRLFYLHQKTNHMTKIIFLLWLLSGKVQVQKDGFGFNDYNDGRLLYTVEVSPTVTRVSAYKGEILNFIRTKSWQDNEDFSDDNGRITEPNKPIGTVEYSHKGKLKSYPLYADGKKRYIIDEYLKVRVYLKK